MIVQRLCVIASFDEFASGVLLRPRIAFHMSFLLLFLMASSSTPFQLSVLESMIASFASLQASIHFWWLALIVQQCRLRVRIFVLTSCVIRDLAFHRGLVFPTRTFVTAFRISVKQAKYF